MPNRLSLTHVLFRPRVVGQTSTALCPVVPGLSSAQLFARTDNGSGGLVQTVKRRLKFEWRYRLHRHDLQTLADLLQRHGLGGVVHTDPFLLMRPWRSYLWHGLGVRERVEALHAHLHWLLQPARRALACRLYGEGHVPLFELQRQDDCITVSLHPGRALGREGALEVHLGLNGRVVLQAAFSVLPARMAGVDSEGLAMVIGNMQGGQNGPELVRQATRLAEHIRPRTVLMTALQGLAQGWQLDALRGVSRQSHVYAGYRSLSRRVSADYDGLWEDLGGHRPDRTATHWTLPLQMHLRPDSEVASRKRAEHRRRNALRVQILEDCAAIAATSPSRGIQAAHTVG